MAKKAANSMGAMQNGRGGKEYHQVTAGGGSLSGSFNSKFYDARGGKEYAEHCNKGTGYSK
jgi:hypothetical protein